MKQLPFLILQSILLLITSMSSSCQSNNGVPGVYAGVKLSLNPLGGGMNRTDVVILLRKDKTFTDQLNKKDWKTAVRGKYEIKGSELLLSYTNGDKDEYTITKSGNLDAGTFVLFKMELENKVPKGTYIFKFINGSGGIATGTTYVGTSSKKSLNFDGIGNFSTDRESTTVIAGDNIGGGTNSKSDGKGKYKLESGTLTLQYDNGTKTVHSFFASAGEGKNKAMAVIDGSFYFTEDAKETRSEKLPTANQIHSELRKKYGGDALDNINTYIIKAEFNGIKMISYNDLIGNRFRNEMYHQGKLLAVEQIGPDAGWTWNNGKKTLSTNQRLKEVKYNNYTGVLGLQKKYSAAFQKAVVTSTKDGYSLRFQVDGNHYEYIVDRDYTILSDSYQIGSSEQRNSYSNNKKIDGVTLPFTTVSSSGKNKVTIRYESVEINKPLTTTWQAP